YHRCQRDAEAAAALVRVAKKHGAGVMGQPDFEIIAAARRGDISGYREGFADRLMLPDGSLAPRTQAGSVLDPVLAARQAVALARSGRYDTICVHGDTKGAAQIAAAVRRALREAGVETSPLGSGARRRPLLSSSSWRLCSSAAGSGSLERGHQRAS